MALDPNVEQQLNTMQATIDSIRRNEQRPQIPAIHPVPQFDPMFIKQLVANEIAQQTKTAAPVAAAPAAPTGPSAPIAPGNINPNTYQKLAMVAVLGEENTGWLLQQGTVDLMAFAVSKEGRAALTLLFEEAKGFVKAMRAPPTSESIRT